MRFSKASLALLVTLWGTPVWAQLAQTGAGSSAGQSFANFLLYDNFTGTPASINGRVPNKGPAWSVTGAAAANVIAGAGVLTQNADVLAGYSINNLGVVAQKLTAYWRIASGAVDFVPAMMIAANSGLTPMIHAEGGTTNFLLRLVTAGPTFTQPSWWVTAPNYSISVATPYRTVFQYNGAKFASLQLFSDTGTLLGTEVTYDPWMASYGGNWVGYETYNTRLGYTTVAAEAVADYPWPTLNSIAELANPTTPANFAASQFGGTVTNGGSGIVVAGTTYGQGGVIDVGSLLAGDRIWFSFDVTGLTSTSMEASLLVKNVLQLPISNEILYAGNGRIQGTLTATQDATAVLVIGISAIGSAGASTVSNLVILKNPPTAP